MVDVVDSINWLDLPEHITSHIMSKLSCTCDYTRFGAVCVQWRSVFIHGGTKLIPRQLPLLMIRTPPLSPLPSQSSGKKNKKKKKKKKNSDTSSSTTISCSFYRVTDGKIFNRLKVTLPRERYVRGSGYGWLITVDDDDICFSVQLINPFFYPNASTKEIKLPPLIANPSPYEETDPANINYTHLQKAVLSADPVLKPKDFMVMAIFGGYGSLAFCKPGVDKAWTPMEDNLAGGNLLGRFIDIIYYEGKFYALNDRGVVVVCNMARQMTETFAMPMMPIVQCRKKYLVESVGELFQVHRYVNNQHNTERFHVFKLKRRESSTDWVEVKDLCDRAFFIGDSPSMSISASDFPGCKPNHIYYTDDAVHSQYYYSGKPGYGPRDLGVFDLKNGIFEKHYSTTGEPWPAPIWIEPTSIINSKRSILRNQLL